MQIEKSSFIAFHMYDTYQSYFLSLEKVALYNSSFLSVPLYYPRFLWAVHIHPLPYISVVFRGGGKDDAAGKLGGATGKFLGKSTRQQGTSNQTNSISLQQGNFSDENDGASDEFYRLFTQLELLKEKHILLGNHSLVNRIAAMQDAAHRAESQVSTIQVISTSIRLNDLNGSMGIEETDISASCKLEKAAGSKASREEKRCRACIEKNGMRSKEREDSSTEDNKAHSREEKVAAKPEEGTIDASVSTSSKLPTTEDIATETNREVNAKDESKEKSSSKGKSGHARTAAHAIIINLDDKSRFSEEVTV